MQSYNIIPHLIVSALMCPGFIDIILADLTDMWQKCQANHQKTKLPKLCIISIWNEWWCSLLLWHFVFAKSNCIIISYVQETEGNIQCYFPYFLLSIRPSKLHIWLFCYVQLPTADPLMNSNCASTYPAWANKHEEKIINSKDFLSSFSDTDHAQSINSSFNKSVSFILFWLALN